MRKDAETQMTTKTGEQLLYKKESYQIRGACFAVWKEFGGAFKESVIDRALSKEFKVRGLKVDSQKRIPIFYHDEQVGVYVPDFILQDKILIELKCKPYLTKGDERQFWLYLRGSHYKLGFLINFGSRKLEIKRRVYDKAREGFPRKSAF